MRLKQHRKDVEFLKRVTGMEPLLEVADRYQRLILLVEEVLPGLVHTSRRRRVVMDAINVEVKK